MMIDECLIENGEKPAARGRVMQSISIQVQQCLFSFLQNYQIFNKNM